MSKSFSVKLFNQMPVIGIMRNVPEQHIPTIARKYYQAGLTCLEITMNSPNAEKTITKLENLYGDYLNIGAGTVCSMLDLEKAIAAKARFIVAPIINEQVIKKCVVEGIPIFPGAYTASEIYKASTMGAFMVKLFPASDLKPGYIKEILAPLNGVGLVPTGGITLDNFTQYLAAGAKGVGIGGQLFPKEIIERQDWDALSDIFTQFVKKYREFKSVR